MGGRGLNLYHREVRIEKEVQHPTHVVTDYCFERYSAPPSPFTLGEPASKISRLRAKIHFCFSTFLRKTIDQIRGTLASLFTGYLHKH